MLPPNTWRHLLTALEATPEVVKALANHAPLAAGEPDRFTFAEVLAHLADWELVFQNRIQRTLDEDGPDVDDPDSWSRRAAYAAASPEASLDLFGRRRAHTVALVSGLDERSLARECRHPRHGLMTVEAQTVHIVGHDGYHTGYLARLSASPRR